MLTPESLPPYTVRLKLIDGSGTGFFVGQGLILTCLHVVKDARDNRETIEIIWQGQISGAKIINLPNLDGIDLALLQLNSSLDHKYVDFDHDLQLTDKLYTFGYTNDYPNGDPSDFEYIGLTGDENPLIKFKLGQVQPGFSGSPLLNLRTGKVCGVVNKTRDEYSDLGGRAIPVQTIFKYFPQLQPQKNAHNPFKPTSGGIKEIQQIFGREQEIKDIFEVLNSGSSAAIIGERGTGKTTMLWGIYHQAREYLLSHRQPLYLNLEGLAGDKDFYYELCHQIGIAANYDKPLKGTRLTRELEKHKILLLLDVVDNMTQKYFSYQLRSQLRELANRPDPPLRLVVAANRSLDVLFPDNKGGDSPFEGICQQFPIKLWDEAKIKEFISHRLSQTGVTFTEEEISSLVRQSQGKPREVMQNCFKLYQTKVNNSASRT